MKESDLSVVAKQFLKDQGCEELYGEVYNIDLVGINKSIIYAIELKTTLNIKVMEQAAKRKEVANYVYVAVPADKLPNYFHGLNEVYKLFFKYNGIGLIKIYPEQKTSGLIETTFRYYQVLIHAKINRYNQYKRYLIANLVDERRDMDGGLQTSEIDSPYKRMINEVKEYMAKEKRINQETNGWLSIDQIVKACLVVKQHYANPKAGLRATLNAPFNASWCERNNNMYRYTHNTLE